MTWNLNNVDVNFQSGETHRVELPPFTPATHGAKYTMCNPSDDATIKAGATKSPTHMSQKQSIKEPLTDTSKEKSTHASSDSSHTHQEKDHKHKETSQGKKNKHKSVNKYDNTMKFNNTKTQWIRRPYHSNVSKYDTFIKINDVNRSRSQPEVSENEKRYNYATFDPKTQLVRQLKDQPLELDWYSVQKSLRKLGGFGQLKLMIGEMEFFNEYADLVKDPDSIVMYAGSGRGYHLAELIPALPQHLQWHLYDPQGHYTPIKQFSNVTETADVFNLTQAMDIRKGKKLLFISDIRFKPNFDEVLRDWALHDAWLEKLDPEAATYKWRLPYTDKDNKHHSFTYRQCDNQDIRFQCYNSTISGEARMFLTQGHHHKVTLTPAEQLNLGNRILYYNVMMRGKSGPGVHRFLMDDLVAKSVIHDFNKNFGTKIELGSLMNAIIRHIKNEPNNSLNDDLA